MHLGNVIYSNDLILKIVIEINRGVIQQLTREMTFWSLTETQTKWLQFHLNGQSVKQH